MTKLPHLYTGEESGLHSKADGKPGQVSHRRMTGFNLPCQLFSCSVEYGLLLKPEMQKGLRKMNVLNNSMLALQRVSPLSVCGQKVPAVFPVIITVVPVSCLTILIIKTSPLNQANP